MSSIEIPDELANLLASDHRHATAMIRLLVGIELFRRGEASSGWIAERLGMPRQDFIGELGRHHVDYLASPDTDTWQPKPPRS